MDCSLVRTLVQRYVSAALGRTGSRAGTGPGERTPPPLAPRPRCGRQPGVPEGSGGLLKPAVSRGTSRAQGGPTEFAPSGFRRGQRARARPRPPPAPGAQPRPSREPALGWSSGPRAGATFRLGPRLSLVQAD